MIPIVGGLASKNNGDLMLALAKKLLLSLMGIYCISTMANPETPNPKISFRDKIENIVAEVDDFVRPQRKIEYLTLPVLPLVSYFLAKKCNIPKINSTAINATLNIAKTGIASYVGLLSWKFLNESVFSRYEYCQAYAGCQCLTHMANKWHFLDINADAKSDLLEMPYPEFLKTIGYPEKHIVEMTRDLSNWEMRKQMIHIKYRIRALNHTNSWWESEWGVTI